MKNSRPYAIVNLLRDIGDGMLNHIQEIIEAVSNSYGDEFFNKITVSLSKVIKADYTFIAILNKEAYCSKSIALVAKGELIDNIEYSLKDTPCADAADDSVCCYPKGVCAAFPNDQLLVDMKIEAYLGTPLHDSNQNVMGLIVALYEQPISDEQQVLTLFQLFSGRIAAEFERIDYEQSLEDKITARTAELSETVKQLQMAQKQLVESEKMSALGNLVAGVAHEVNTPLGIAITTHSIIADELRKLEDKLDSQSLSMKDMESFRHTAKSAISMQGDNLIRAKNLMANFKKTAADQHQLELETLDIGKYYQQVISTLHSILKPQKVSLEIECQDKIVLATYPGVHAQILTNLISNSVKHGFSNSGNNDISPDNTNQENKISISVKQLPTGEVTVSYCDNGRGLSEKAEQHVFEPFFTTARKRGGIGLGMSIVYNLISQKLNGAIELKNSNSGACFHYKFKANNLSNTLN